MRNIKFKYKLGKGPKHICPKCGRKTFVLYIDTDTGQPLSDEVGKCDRADHCGWHYPPRCYFQDRGLNRRAMPEHRQRPRLEPVSRPVSYIDKSKVWQSMGGDYSNNNLVNHVFGLACKLYGKEEGERRVCDALLALRVGNTETGDTIFWQMDYYDNCRTGKVMRYKPDGHRDHDRFGTWKHKEEGKDFNMEQCLFGLNLVGFDSRHSTHKPVIIVESEKTALYGHVFMPEYLWVATGGCGGLSREKCKELFGRGKVISLPDLGMTDKWEQKSKELGIQVSRFLEEKATAEDREKGLDIADFIERQIMNS